MRRDVAYEREPNLKILPTERRREIERQTAVNHVWTVTAAQLIRAGRARHNPRAHNLNPEGNVLFGFPESIVVGTTSFCLV